MQSVSSNIILILCLLLFNFIGNQFLGTSTYAQSHRGEMSLEDFLSQSNTPYRQQWQKSPPTTLTNKISNDPSYKAMLDYLRTKENNTSAQGTFNYWEQFDENYHSWDFCPYEGTRIGEYLKAEEVTDRCCVCNDGWQCQFESRNVSQGQEFRQCLSPDLALQNFFVTSSETLPGIYLASFSFDAKNIGSGNGQAFDINIFLDDEKIGGNTFMGLDVQESITITNEDLNITTTDLEVTSGDYVFRAELSLVDDFSGPAEIFDDTNTENNLIEESLSIIAPDITITDLTVTAENEVIGQSQKYILSTTVQSLGAHLPQSAQLNITQITGDGTEMILSSNDHTIFNNPNQTEEFIDTSLFLPFGDYLLRTEIIPQQYDDNIANNIYEETVAVSMPSFTPIAIESMSHFIYENGVRALSDNETIFLKNGTTDGILTQVKTNLLADVITTWKAIDSQGNEIQPFETEDYTTAFGHGGRFQFLAAETYTIQATFTDIYNDNNTNTFDIITINTVIPEPPAINITNLTAEQNTSGITNTFNPGDSLNIDSSGTANPIIFTINSSLESNANISMVELVENTTQTTFQPDTISTYNPNTGYSITFNTLSGLSGGLYTFRAKIKDNNNAANELWTDDFTFNLVKPLIGIQSAYYLENGITNNFNDSDTITLPSSTSFQQFDFIVKHSYGTNAQVNLSVGNTPLWGSNLLDGTGHLMSYFIFSPTDSNIVVQGNIIDVDGNTIDIPDFSFSIAIDDSINETSFNAFYDGDMFNGNLINNGDTVQQQSGQNTKTTFCLQTSGGSNVALSGILTDSQSNTITVDSLSNYDLQYGYCLFYKNLSPDNYTFTAKATDISDPSNYYETNPFSFTLSAPTPTITIRGAKNSLYPVFSGDSINMGESIDIYVQSNYGANVNIEWFIEDQTSDVDPIHYTIDPLYTQAGYKATITPPNTGEYIVYAKVSTLNDPNNYSSSEDFYFTVE